MDRAVWGSWWPTLRGWATTLTSRISATAEGVKAVAVLPGGFTSKLGLVRSKFLSAALHGGEASKAAQGAFFKVSFCLRFRGLVQEDAFGA